MKIYSMAVAAVVLGSFVGGCTADEADEANGTIESDATGGIAEDSEDAARIVKLANEMPLQALVDEAKLSKIAALNIDAYRKGDDETLGTDDDERFESLAELDGLPMIGPSEFRQLRDVARAKPSAIITGRVVLGTDGALPAFRIYAMKTDGSKYYAFHRRVSGPSSFAIAVEPGDYFVVAYHAFERTLGYTTPDHFLAVVSATEGQTTSGVDTADLRTRRVPIEPTSPATFGCGTVAYGGACGDVADLGVGPGGPQATLTWCEGNILRRKVCDAGQKCAWQSDDVGFNCMEK